ncbi:MAG TPA: pitrilysin family protein [Gemmatimonadaceae bacterium]|jgi:zinc protease|nr:pitrilysin family protein [Gemmatimonadaceae bacterium]
MSAPFTARLKRWLASIAIATTSVLPLSPLLPAARGAAQIPPLRPLAYTRFILPNGLTAILNEDHSAPIAVVDVWFHVGSKDDKPGHTGMAHLCEHLSDLRAPQLDQPFATFYSSIGGTSPHFGATTEDITHFYVAVPPNQLETVLWAEGGRLAAPFTGIDSAQLRAVIGVIARERESSVDAVPLAVYRELIVAAMFPASHPYHRTPLPPMPELNSTTVADLRDACAPYYVVNNAVVSISGDIDAIRARGLVMRYFGHLPRGAVPPRPAAPAVTLRAEQRLVLEDRRVTVPRLAMAWPGAAFGASDRAALRAIAFALAAPRFGRISRLLVDERKLAANVIVNNYDFEKGGVFEITVFPRPGASMTTIESVIDSVVADLRTTRFTAREIERFNAYDRVASTASLETRFARADTLGQGQVFVGDPVAYARQSDAARTLTAVDLGRAARKYLTPGRVVMSMVPAGKLDLASKPDLPYHNVTPPSSVGSRAIP